MLSGPFAASRVGCGGAALATISTGGSPCPARPTWVGVKWFPYPRPGELCLGFACDAHRDQLDVARPLDDEARAELERRRERDRRVLVDKQPERKDPPLAIGAEGRERLARARAWAAEHPGWHVQAGTTG